MGAIPNKVQDKIQYAENHITPWTDNATAIGTTTTAVSDLIPRPRLRVRHL